MSSIALAVVGCGLRAECYLKQMGVGSPDCPVRLVAVADPKPAAAAHYVQRYSDDPEAVRVFDTGPQLLDMMGDELDAIIIASPNAYHRETLLPAFEKKMVVLLEKPVATTIGPRIPSILFGVRPGGCGKRDVSADDLPRRG